jgi:hypothetical protein
MLEGKLGNQLKNDEGMCLSGKWVGWFVRENFLFKLVCHTTMSFIPKCSDGT